MEKEKLEELFIKVNETWEWYVENKNQLAFNDMEIEQDEFAELVRDTYDVICAFADEIEQSKTEYLSDYICMISSMSEYSSEWPAEDESEDCFFTVSRLLAKDLATIGSYPVHETLKKQNRIIHSDVADKWCYGKECKYNVDEGDFSEYIELAKSGVCP